MKHRTYRLLLAAVVTGIAAPLLIVNACGPDFEPDVFTPAMHPQQTQAFLRGQLGILQPTYWIAEKVAAYRYLNGGVLSEQEQKAWLQVNGVSPDWEHMTPEQYQKELNQEKAAEENTPLEQWKRLRATVQPDATYELKAWSGWITFGEQSWQASIENCNDQSFSTAVSTWKDRAQRWKGHDAWLHDWVMAQDAVFSNCNGVLHMPQDAPAGAPELLQQDRAYQLASAHFYRGEYDEAYTAYLAIAQDASSPWSRWGTYLAARSLVRKSAKAVPSNETDSNSMAKFDLPLLQKAEETLQPLLKSSDAAMAHAAQQECDFIAVRLHPAQHLDVIAVALAGPKEDRNFEQHVADLRFMLNHNLSGTAALPRWIAATSGDATVEKNTLATWKQFQNLPWLVAALQTAHTADPSLLQAAASVAPGSAGWMTVQYHRARLLLQGDPGSARAIATTGIQIAEKQKDIASANELLSVRMQSANSLQEMLQDAPRTMLEGNSQSAFHVCGQNCNSQQRSLQFDTDTASIFNQQLPLQQWLFAARDTALPAYLQQSLVLVGWTRAAILKDTNTLHQFQTLLPQDLHALPQSGDEGYDAAVVMLHAPGLHPALDGGVQRTQAYRELDHYRSNLWCSTHEVQTEASDLPAPAAVRFLSPSQRQRAAQEVAMLQSASDGLIWVGANVLSYAKLHPDTGSMPESLALLVRASRYRCYSGDADEKKAKEISKEAFTILHRTYPRSPWTAKTPYYF